MNTAGAAEIDGRGDCSSKAVNEASTRHGAIPCQTVSSLDRDPLFNRCPLNRVAETAKCMSTASGLGESKKPKIMEEYLWKHLVAKENKGAIEVATPVGKIDVLCESSLYEIKHVRQWKHALGQVLAYGFFHPSKRKIVYLFGASKEKTKVKIESVCRFYGVHAIFPDFGDASMSNKDINEFFYITRKIADNIAHSNHNGKCQ